MTIDVVQTAAEVRSIRSYWEHGSITEQDTSALIASHLALFAALDALTAERDAFERDYTAVGARNEELHAQAFAWLAELDAERERVRVLRSALEWYGQSATWASSPGRTVHLDGRVTTWTSRPVDSDGGRIALAALAATEDGGGA